MGRPQKYPWDELDVGDSFLVTTGKPIEKLRKSIYSSAKNAGYRVRTSVLGPHQIQVWIVE